MADKDEQTTGPYIFKSAKRLQQAKGDLYAYLAHHGFPDENHTYVAGVFKLRFARDSPILFALDAWVPRGAKQKKLTEILTNLRTSIYLSELRFGVDDHFDARLKDIAPPRPPSKKAPEPAPVEQAVEGAGGRSFVRVFLQTLLFALLLWVGATAMIVWQDRARVAEMVERASGTYRVSVSALAYSLPVHYADCLARSGGRGCAPVEGARDPQHVPALRDLRVAFRDTGALIDALARAHSGDQIAPGRYLTAVSHEECGVLQRGATAVARTQQELCGVRARITDHLICVSQPDGIDLTGCLDIARLGVVGSRFQSAENSALPIPVNIFSQTLELKKELKKFASLANGAQIQTGVATMVGLIADSMADDLEALSDLIAQF